MAKVMIEDDNHGSCFSTAGVFELWTGDHLHVEVSEHGVVSFQRESSYLGLIMLGTEKKI